MCYLIKVISLLKILLIFLLILISQIDANILKKKKTDTKINVENDDVIIITDFKGDSLSNLLNQLKSNSSLKPLSERIEKTIKLSNLKNVPGALSTGSQTGKNAFLNNHKFNNLNSLIDKANLNRFSSKLSYKLSDKLNVNTDKFSSSLKFNLDESNSVIDKLSNDNLIKSKLPNFNFLNGFNDRVNLNSNLNNPKFATNYYNGYPSNRFLQTSSDYYIQNANFQNHLLTNQKLSYPTFYSLNNHPSPNYPSSNYYQLNNVPNKASFNFNYDHKIFDYNSKPPSIQQMGFDQNKHLLSSYNQNNLLTNSTLSTNLIKDNKFNPFMDPFSQTKDQKFNLIMDQQFSRLKNQKPFLLKDQSNFPNSSQTEFVENLSEDLESESLINETSIDEITKRNMFENHLIRPTKVKPHSFPPSIPFNYKNPHFKLNGVENFYHPLKKRLEGQFNSQLDQLELDKSLNEFNFDNENNLRIGQELTNQQSSSNKSTQISNEFINSLINKLNEKKLLNIDSQKEHLSKDDKTTIKKLPVLSSSNQGNKSSQSSLEQDEDLIRNNQLLTKFEQINNKILTNLLLTSYLNNLNKNPPKINDSLNKNFLDTFEDDSQDRLAESNIIRKKVRRRSQAPSQIIIKKYIQIPNTNSRKKIKKTTQRKNLNTKQPAVVRPLIIKKIETPSIVIETPNSKLKKNLALKNYLTDSEDSLEDEDSLNNYLSFNSFGLNSRLNSGLNNYGDNGKLDNGDGYDFRNYRILGSYNNFKNKLNNYDRNLYIKKRKFDLNDQTDSQFNENKSRRINLYSTMNPIPNYSFINEETAQKPLDYHYNNHFGDMPNNQQNNLISNQINKPINNQLKNQINNNLNGLIMNKINNLHNDQLNDQGISKHNINPSSWFSTTPISNDKFLTNSFERILGEERIFNNDERNDKFDDKFNGKLDNKLINKFDDKFSNSISNNGNMSKLVYALQQQNELNPSVLNKVPKLIIIDDTK